MFCDIIAQIEFSFFPVYVEMASMDSVSEQVESHVHCFGHRLPYGFVGKSCRALIIELDWCWALWVSKFDESLTEWEEIFCGEEACTSLGFLGGGHDSVYDFT